jgi:hypothetical protein
LKLEIYYNSIAHLFTFSVLLVPVNFLRAKDGQPRIYQEQISFEHQYNSRIDPNYQMRNKVRFVVKVFDNKNNRHFYNTVYVFGNI